MRDNDIVPELNVSLKMYKYRYLVENFFARLNILEQ